MPYRIFILFLVSVFLVSFVVAQESPGSLSTAAKPIKKSAPSFSWDNPLPANHHPALRHATFHSPTMDVEVGYNILLPPNYDPLATEL